MYFSPPASGSRAQALEPEPTLNTMRCMRTTLVLFAVLAVGCSGGDDDGASCPETFSACGGDVAGTWTVGAFCVDSDQALEAARAQCPAATADGFADQSGSYVVNADGTYSENTEFTFDFTVSLPASCLMGLSCAQLQALAPSLGDCLEDSGGCACSSKGTESTVDTGTWTINGNSLTLDGADDTQTFDYCVDGDTLTVQDDGDVEEITVLTRN
jgi:hypothetical protein